MPRLSASAMLSAPIAKRGTTAVESQLMISPPCRSASDSASALFPVAVGPRTAMSRLVMSADAEQDVDDEYGEQDQKTELLRTRHRGGVSFSKKWTLTHPFSPAFSPATAS